MKYSGCLGSLHCVGSLAFAIMHLSCMTGLANDRKPEGNAALQYWPALDAIPHICNAGDDWGAARHDPIHVSLSEVQTILTDFHRTTILGNARRGARMPYCDWGLPKNGPNVRLVHAQRFHSLSALFIINARQLIAEDKPDQAVDDLFSLILAGRHIASDGTMVSNLIRHKHEERAIRMIAHIIPQLSRQSCLLLDKKMRGIPLGPTPVDFVNTQREFWLSWLRQSDTAAKRAVARDAILNGIAKEAYDTVDLGHSFETNESVQHLIDEADGIYLEMALAARKPYSESKLEYKRLETTLSSTSSSSHTLLTSFTPISDVQRLEERQATRAAELYLLQAGISHRLTGNAVLADFDDTVLSKPPSVELDGNGFVLRSVSALTSKEVSMAFGDGALPLPREQPDQVYPVGVDAKSDIAAALKTAELQNKLVLVHFGGNWCGPCIRLHNVLSNDVLVAPIVRKHYVVVKVNVGRFNKNMDIAVRYGLDLRACGVPVLVALGMDGRLIIPEVHGNRAYISDIEPAKLSEVLLSTFER